MLDGFWGINFTRYALDGRSIKNSTPSRVNEQGRLLLPLTRITYSYLIDAIRKIAELQFLDISWGRSEIMTTAP